MQVDDAGARAAWWACSCVCPSTLAILSRTPHTYSSPTQHKTRSSALHPHCCRSSVWSPQEFLREHNAAAAETQASAAAAAASAAAEAAAAAGTGVAGGQRAEPLSLWHEMQQRQQAEAAARESEVSVGPGLQGPGGMLGEDLWMFDGGLFAEEGEQAGGLLPALRQAAEHALLLVCRKEAGA